ncbi:MAG: hypothetical protein K2F92_02500 [Alistipes sp.]|nr:hypothetical protein [Alistipes sp.]
MRFFEEVALREEHNDRRIVLYPKGLFYKAYERSAFACVSRISSFVPCKKRIGYLGRELVSIGFPVSALVKYFPDAPQPQADGVVTIALPEPIDVAAAERWKAALPLWERMPQDGGHQAVAEAKVRAAELHAQAVEVNAEPAGAHAEVAAAEELPVAERLGSRKIGRVRGFRTAGDAGVPARMPVRSALLASRRERESKADRIVRLIRDYRLEAATPVECVLFIADLKKEIDGYL